MVKFVKYGGINGVAHAPRTYKRTRNQGFCERILAAAVYIVPKESTVYAYEYSYSRLIYIVPIDKSNLKKHLKEFVFL